MAGVPDGGSKVTASNTDILPNTVHILCVIKFKHLGLTTIFQNLQNCWIISFNAVRDSAAVSAVNHYSLSNLNGNND